MPHLKRLSAEANVFEVFSAFPDIYLPWAHVTEQLFRGPGALSFKDRETLFAFCSGLNACKYCFGSHSQVAKNFGQDLAVFDALQADIDSAPIEARLKPLFKYARKLIETPARMIPDDAASVYAAGWDDETLHLTVAIACMASFMNRLVEGCGLPSIDERNVLRARALTEMGYVKPFEQKLAERRAQAAR